MYLSSVSSRLLLYDVNNWELKHSYGVSGGLIRDVSWSDDSKYILMVNPKGDAEILSPAIPNLSLQHIPIDNSTSARFQRDGHRNIAIGTKKGEVVVWDAKNKEKVKVFPTSSTYSSVNFLSFNAKNTSLAATMQNGITVIYGLVSNIPVGTVKLNCSESISAMKFHHEARSLLGFATDEGHVLVRDITTNKDKVVFRNSHSAPVTDFVYSLINRDVMLSTGYDKVMQIYDIRQQNVVSTTKTSHTLSTISINAENQVALGTQSGSILLYDLRDLTKPFKVLRGHENTVQKVAFQPLRKRFTMNAELSLVEKLESNNSVNIEPPVQDQSSDIFLVNNTTPRRDSPGGDNEDSFLAMVGLAGKSNDDFNDNNPRELTRTSDKYDYKHQFEPENNYSKSSTPITNKIVEKVVMSASPVLNQNGSPEGASSNFNLSTIKPGTSVQNIVVDNKTIEDLKDAWKLDLSYLADDNKKYFLHIMMALTKQKLYLEKELSFMSNQIENLTQNQNALIEANRKLSLEIDQLKSNNSY